MNIQQAIKYYREDADSFGDNPELVMELMNKLNESLGSIQEGDKSSYVSFLKEYRSQLDGEEKAIFEDFITYCKNI